MIFYYYDQLRVTGMRYDIRFYYIDNINIIGKLIKFYNISPILVFFSCIKTKVVVKNVIYI